MSHSNAHPQAQPILPALHALYIELPQKTMPGGPGKGFSFLLWQVLMAVHTHRAAEHEQELPNTLLQQCHGQVLFEEHTHSPCSQL